MAPRRISESKTTYRRPGFGCDRVDRNHMALFPFRTQSTYLSRRRPILAGKDHHRKDRGEVDGQRSRGRANGSVNDGGRRVQTRKTWRPCGSDGWGGRNWRMRESCQQTTV